MDRYTEYLLYRVRECVRRDLPLDCDLYMQCSLAGLDPDELVDEFMTDDGGEYEAIMETGREDIDPDEIAVITDAEEAMMKLQDLFKTLDKGDK